MSDYLPPDAHGPGGDEFQALPMPSIVEADGDFLDPAKVTAGATAHVPFDPVMGADALVILYLVGTLDDGSVVSFEVEKTVTAESLFPLILNVPSEPILQLVERDLRLGYEVYASDNTGPYPSTERTYRVTAATRLEAPVVAEAKGEWLDPVDVVAGTGAHVRLNWTGMAISQRATMSWDGSSEDTSVSFTVRQLGTQLILVPKDPFVTGNVGGTVDVAYTVVGLGDSVVLPLKVGSATVTPPAPEIDDAISDYLDPRALTIGTIARVPASLELLPGDLVTMHFGDTLLTGEAPEFWADALTIGRWLGTTVEVYYTLLRDGVPSNSTILPLQIGSFDQQDPALPFPAITQATSGLLDLATFEGPAEVTVAVWPLAAAGQTVWVEVLGTAEGGATVITLLDNHVVTGEEATYGLVCPFDRTALEGLDDGSTLTVMVWVDFGGSAYKPNAVLFPLREYTLAKAVAIIPAITNVRDAQGNVPNGGSTTSTTLVLTGTAEPGREVEILDDAAVKGTAQVDPYGNWTLQVSGLSVATHRFTARGRYGTNPTSAAWVITVRQVLTITRFRDYYDAVYTNGSSARPNGPDPAGNQTPPVLCVYPDGFGATPGRVEAWLRYARIDGGTAEFHVPLTDVSADGTFQTSSRKDRAHLLVNVGVINGSTARLWLVDTVTGEQSAPFLFTCYIN